MSGVGLSDFDASGILDELAEAAPEVSFAPVTEALPYRLGEDKSRPVERVTCLERMADKLARGFRAVIEPFARTYVGVTAAKPLLTTYGEWQAELPFFAQHSFGLYRVRPLKGGMMLAIEADMIVALVESFYGGTPGATAKPKSGDFTTSEEMLLKRLVDRLLTHIADQWREHAPIEPQLVQRETSLEHLAFLRADDQVVVQAFTIAPAGSQPSTISFVYPLAALRPIEARMTSKICDDDDDHGGNEGWRARMGEALAHVSLPVRSVLARPEISVAQLLALKAGDVIPITLAPQTPLLAGKFRIAEGVIGEQEGRAALMIAKMGDDLG
ncbi:flagellar motor switch protein FliM [Sphingomonas nostoxanthinifaciens]|uniref:flagellar motor switch protein FliM n=1 Tax=Sphingomonas nostoxanthinifaciens TaxID=2872652 RepID=UPI001CC2138F|nr:flagellar motor switch protein FliM [Sphingomonas nostoxanthinifaciens]UAK26028.1 flagellar motor switch protein FliM [Sphingomonas nostoxanthinifaciens]